MRKSLLKNDPGYDPESYLYEVYLDGYRVKDCHTADEEKGIAIVYINERLDSKTLYGNVRLIKKGGK